MLNIETMKNIVYTFNKFYYDFLKSLKRSEIVASEAKDLIKKDYKSCNYETETHIKNFTESLDSIDFSSLCSKTKNIENFDNLVVLTGLTFKKCVTGTVPDSLISHMYILVLFSHLYKTQNDNDELFNFVMNSLKSIQNGGAFDNDTIMDDDILGLLSNIKDTLPVQLDPIHNLEKTKIGEIAKEIANELNFNENDLKNPADMLKNNGDMLGKIVSNVSSKLQKKFEDGSIKHDELLSEAMSVIGSLGGGSGGQGDLFANLLKTFTQGNATPQQKSSTKKIRRK